MHARIALIPLLVACKATSSLGYLAPPAGDDGRLGLGHLDLHVAKALVSEYGKQVRAAPMSLVPSDGQALELRALAAAVTIEGPLAHTELHFSFHNAEHRNREGRFTITLPAGAAVGRFAMKNGTEWREARVVSRIQGRQVYEQTLKRRIDPALLEQDLGNQFSARVFPIAADADKEIIIAYDHEVSALRPYTLALGGLPAIPQLTIALDHDGEKRTLARGDGDVIVPIAAGTIAVAGDGAFVARIEGVGAVDAPVALDHVMFLVDTSASRSTVMGRQGQLLRALIAALPPETAVVIAAFDHDVDELYRGAARDATGIESALLEHGALGGSDLGAALARVAAAGMERLVIIGDGAPTLGEADPGKLAAIVHASPIDRVDAVQLGQSIDRETLSLIVAAAKHPGAILDGDAPARVAHQLASALAPEVAIHVAGATATWPATTRGVAPGEPVWIFGLRAGTEPLSIELGEAAIAASPRAADATHVHRAVASAQLVALTEELDHAAPDGKVAIAKEIEGVALANKLVSSQTSLLVLESDADEDRQLGPRSIDLAPPPPPVDVEASQPAFDDKTAVHQQEGEVIRIVDTAPMIDPTSTSQGIVIDKSYLRNIPVPGRTFEQTLGNVRGLNQADDGIMTGSFSGASSLENQYYVDGVNSGHAASPPDEPVGPSPYAGKFQKVMQAIHDRHPALELATRMHLDNPGDIVAIVALGEALEARGAHTLAARAYGSLLDLFPSRADLLRAAGERLDRLPGARKLAIDAYRRALKERPDQVSTYRLLAYDLLRDGRDREALDTLAAGLPHAGRESITRILREDIGLIGAHFVAGHPSERADVVARLAGAKLPTARSLRVVLSWETDANDVDLHVRDSIGGHSFYGAKDLPSGGTLLDDVTDGFGPEMFTVDKPGAFPYRVSAKYFRMGPMGFGMGSVQVIRFDGAGAIAVEDRPFLIQTDEATVELGTITE